MVTTGRVLVIGALALIFLAYSNFAPTALSSELIADYVKNHFVREILFGLVLASWAIYLTMRDLTPSRFRMIAFLGTVVVSPFWIAAAFGWSTGGLAEVWGGEIDAGAAYMLHGTQTAAFGLGLVLIAAGRRHGA